MKNIYLHYLLILVPITILLLLNVMDTISSTLFLALLLFYALVYRPYIDGKRLVVKSVIDKKDIWKMVFPCNYMRFFRELYLEK